MATSLMRACHTRLAKSPLIEDPWGDRLVPTWFIEGIRKNELARVGADASKGSTVLPEAMVDAHLRRSPAYAHVILRSRFTEDALAAAVGGGVQQYVVLGAGFDSFALRRPAFARDLMVIEVDHPATQSVKRQRLRECGVTPPENTHYVASDLGLERLASALTRSPFRSDRLTFFSWLGVTMYLTPEANLATLAAIAGCSAPGSQIVFTYLDQQALAASAQSTSFQNMQQTVASIGEPFQSGFDPAALGSILQASGFVLAENLDGAQLAQRYEGAADLVCGKTSYIARALVAC
jgi:methyltransferase (TIGR00027 family)